MSFFVHFFGTILLFAFGLMLNVFFGSNFSKIIKPRSSVQTKRSYIKAYAWIATLVGIYVVANSDNNVVLFIGTPVAIALVVYIYAHIKKMIRLVDESK